MTSRRCFLTLVAGAPLITGCADQLSQTRWFFKMLTFGERLTKVAQRALTDEALAPEYPPSAISPVFRPNGSTFPRNPVYRRLLRTGFRAYRLEIGGRVEQVTHLSMNEVRALPARTQITRHDCVEGWSVIGKWKGAYLSAVLDLVRPLPETKYVMFYCFDFIRGSRYYESISLSEAYHPQTLLAYELNGEPLPIPNGAPLRLRAPRLLGYKMAKYVMRIELVESFEDVYGGQGGYWEDRRYAWYAGI